MCEADKEKLKDQIAVMQAFLDGAQIEFRDHKDAHLRWWGIASPNFDWKRYDYRVKPKTRYFNVYLPESPFVTAKWWESRDEVFLAAKDGVIGYVEDRQDGSPYIFHYYEV